MEEHKRKRINTLDAFLMTSKKLKGAEICDVPSTMPSTSSGNGGSGSSLHHQSSNELFTLPQKLSASKQSPERNLHKYKYDIGKALGKHLSDSEKYQFLKNVWVPANEYPLPYSEHNKSNKILCFSHEKQGLFCKYCVIFAKENIQLKSLVTQPVIKFAKLLALTEY
nr:unnamed protein product [Callosobruchus analis]